MHLLKENQLPTKAEECRSIAEILRDLAVQLRFDDNRRMLSALADKLDWQAIRLELRTTASGAVQLITEA